jgi:adenosylhomocysteine nucleosidase
MSAMAGPPDDHVTPTVTAGDGAIGFLCAMPMELQPLVGPLGLRRRAEGARVRHGSLGGRPVIAIVTGMGTQLATQGAAELLDAGPIDHVVVVGITGALESETPIGTIVLPEVVIDAATGRRHVPAPLGSIPPSGAMWTTDSLTTDPDHLARLRSDGVISLDMETAAVAAVCEDRGVPWSVVRAISDRANDGSVDEEVFGLSHQDGSPNWPAVVRFVLTRPHRLPRLAAVGRGAQRAAGVAADRAVAACR